jgi:formylglycine-generating enzyme required for sulfatase activity
MLTIPACQKKEGPADEERVRAPQVMTTKSGIEMVLIPAGRFEMGSRNGQEDERPVREVSVDAFWMDRTEVTQEQYAKYIRPDPSHFKGPNNPVEQISWANAAIYCNKRSAAEGLKPCYDEATAKCDFEAGGYRLPTEAEWEYACRAGTETDYSFGGDARPLKDYAWFAENAAKQTHPVRAKKPNAWGLFDMYGNVAEWCNDIYEKDYYRKGPSKNPRGPEDGEKYVLRGGAWNSTAQACRSAYRVGEDPGFQDACFARDAIGFRCVRAVRNASTAPGAR